METGTYYIEVVVATEVSNGYVLEIATSPIPPPDTTPPTTTIGLAGTGGLGGWYLSAVTVTLSATDEQSATMSHFKLDDGPWTVYGSPITVSENGTHVISYYSNDTAGNVEETLQAEFAIDVDKPTTDPSIEGNAGSPGWYVSEVNITLEAIDNDSGVAETLVSVEHEPYHSYVGPVHVSGQGAHSLSWYSVDTAGNVEDEKVLSFGIDTVVPVSDAVLLGSQGADNWFSGGVNVSISRSDATSGIAVVKYRLDLGAWTNLTGWLFVGTSGEHTVDFYSIDVAGNVEGVNSIAFHVDNDPPHTSANMAGTEGTHGWYLGPVTVSLAATDDGYVQTVWQRVDSGAWAIYPYGGIQVMSGGKHVLQYYATDIANNREATVSLDVWIDTTSPVPLTPEISPEHSTDGSVSVLWGASDTYSGLATTFIYVDGTSRGYSAEASGVITLSGLSDGAHNVTIVSTDAAGNSGTNYASFTVDTNPLSPTGPYGPDLLIVIVIALCAFAVILVLLRKRLV
jgi:hypothetical protein